MFGKCPYCNGVVTRVNLVPVTSSSFMGTEWHTLLYTCPLCQKILSTSIDPIAIQTDIIDAIKGKRI